MIYIDTRERKPFSLTDTWKGVEVKVITMKTADYTNDEGLLVERKSVPDICGSLGKGKKRFMAEVERGFDYLIIEGTKADIGKHLKRRKSRMTVGYIMKMLNEIHNKHGVQVLLCENREEAASIALYLLNGGTV